MHESKITVCEDKDKVTISYLYLYQDKVTICICVVGEDDDDADLDRLMDGLQTILNNIRNQYTGVPVLIIG